MENDNTWYDYYELLGVEYNASEDIIKKEYRKKIKQYHPDLFAKKSIEEQKEAEKKSKILNIAYDTLTNKKKREKYNAIYEARKNGTYNPNGQYDDNYEEVKYEDVKNNYTEQEAYYAEIEAIKEIINEELSNIKNIIEVKNSIIKSATYSQINPEEYHIQVEELLSIVGEFVLKLNELKNKAKEYELYREIDIIDNQISYLEEEISKIPKSSKEAKFITLEEEQKNNALKEYEILKLLTDNCIDKIYSILNFSYEGGIQEDEYNVIISNIKLESNDILSRSSNLIQVLGLLKLDKETKELTRVTASLDSLLLLIPDNYKTAKKYGEIINASNNLIKILSEKDKFEINVKRIKKLLLAHPHSGLYQRLYKETVKAYETLEKKLDIVFKDTEKIIDFKKDTLKAMTDMIDKALSSYKTSINIHKNADKVFNKRENARVEGYDIPTLTKSSYAAFDKYKALEEFLKSRKLLETYNNVINFLNTTELRRLYHNLEIYMDTFTLKSEEFTFKFSHDYVMDNYLYLSDDELYNLVVKHENKSRLYLLLGLVSTSLFTMSLINMFIVKGTIEVPLYEEVFRNILLQSLVSGTIALGMPYNGIKFFKHRFDAQKLEKVYFKRTGNFIY